jgi:hypothetical protein
LRERFQESFLCGFFSLTSIAKESMRDLKDSRAESSNDFSERRLIVFAREAGQFNFRSVFVPVRQKPLLWKRVSEPRAVASGSRGFRAKQIVRRKPNP